MISMRFDEQPRSPSAQGADVRGPETLSARELVVETSPGALRRRERSGSNGIAIGEFPRRRQRFAAGETGLDGGEEEQVVVRLELVDCG